MGLMCLIGKHKWDGCKCSACDKTRDEGHDWGKDCEKCARCGAERKDAHKWTGCKCSVCGKTRDEGHDWSANCEKCSCCGKTRKGTHDWKRDCQKCSRCGAERTDGHKWDGCKCSVCNKVRDEGHDWSKDCEKCSRCGKTRSDGHSWNGYICSICGTIKPGSEDSRNQRRMKSEDLGMLLIFDKKESRDKAFDLMFAFYQEKFLGRKHIEKRINKNKNGCITVRGETRLYSGMYYIVLANPDADFWHTTEWELMTKNACRSSADPLIYYGEIQKFSDPDGGNNCVVEAPRHAISSVQQESKQQATTISDEQLKRYFASLGRDDLVAQVEEGQVLRSRHEREQEDREQMRKYKEQACIASLPVNARDRYLNLTQQWPQLSIEIGMALLGALAEDVAVNCKRAQAGDTASQATLVSALAWNLQDASEASTFITANCLHAAAGGIFKEWYDKIIAAGKFLRYLDETDKISLRVRLDAYAYPCEYYLRTLVRDYPKFESDGLVKFLLGMLYYMMWFCASSYESRERMCNRSIRFFDEAIQRGIEDCDVMAFWRKMRAKAEELKA